MQLFGLAKCQGQERMRLRFIGIARPRLIVQMNFNRYNLDQFYLRRRKYAIRFSEHLITPNLSDLIEFFSSNIIYETKVCQLTQVPTNSQIVTIFLSCFGFTQQLLLFKRQGSTGSFSIFLTAVIIIASILKINFWFISPFKTAIFVQMFILISLHVAFALLQLLITKQYVKINGHKVDTKKGVIYNFWQWESFSKYLLFLAFFSLVLATITYISIKQQYVFMGQVYGYLATVCEISLAFPQIYKIWRFKTAKGVSQKMIAIWLCSDVYKTIYFISNAQPLQFIATGCIQTVTDLVLGSQMWFYRNNSAQENKKL